MSKNYGWSNPFKPGYGQLDSEATVSDAIRLGKQLRIDCAMCGNRKIGLAHSLKGKLVSATWGREDIRKRFRCTRARNAGCKLKSVKFEVIFTDCERL